MILHTLLLTNIGTTNSIITDTTDRYEPIITVGVVAGVGGDFSHTDNYSNRLGDMLVVSSRTF